MSKISKLIPIATLVFFFCFQNNLKAQDIDFEDVKKICKKNIPREDRIRVSVVRFSSRMRIKNRNNLGSELATMLTNALYEVNCFRVLESADKIGDFKKEYNLSKAGYTSGTGSSKGKMLSPQAIITGEITEYAEGSKNTDFFGVNIGSQTANVGFIIKVLDIHTREVLFSESVNMKGKASGFKGARSGRFKIVGKTDKSKALNNAIEKAIIKATEVLAVSKDEWGIESSNAQVSKSIQIVVNRVSFSDVVNFDAQLKSMSGITNVSKLFKSGKATFTVTTNTSGEDLAFEILNMVGNKYEITEVNSTYVSLKKN